MITLRRSPFGVGIVVLLALTTTATGQRGPVVPPVGAGEGPTVGNPSTGNPSTGNQGSGSQGAGGYPPVAGRVGVEAMPPVARDDDQPVLLVAGQAIRASDVFRELDLVVPGRSAEVVRQMLLSAFARRVAVQHGLDVQAEMLEREVDVAIAEQRARFALEAESVGLETFLAARFGFTVERYRAEIRARVLASLLLERAVRFEAARTAREQSQLILVEDLETATGIATKVAEGASFASLARAHSVHPTAADGGDLPDVPLGADVPLLEGREGLQPGDVLGPLPITLNGKAYFRLIRLVDRLQPDLRPWDRVRVEIELELARRPLQPEELAIFEARMLDRYRVSRPGREP